MIKTLWPLFSTGFALIFFGAWGVDFAHLAYIELARGGDGMVNLPILPGRDVKVTAGFWWNLNFFAFMVGGAIMMATAAVL